MMLPPVEVQTVAAPFAIVVDVQDLRRSPLRKFEIVRHDARALLELLLENRRHFLDGHRQ